MLWYLFPALAEVKRAGSVCTTSIPQPPQCCSPLVAMQWSNLFWRILPLFLTQGVGGVVIKKEAIYVLVKETELFGNPPPSCTEPARLWRRTGCGR